MKVKKERGITLIALIITVIIMLILVAVSISIAVNGDLFSYAKRSVEETETAKKYEMDLITGVVGEKTIDELLQGERIVPKGPNGNQLVSSITTIEHDTIIAEDEKGNKVVIPGGFKVATDEYETGEKITVQTGIIIEDSEGNQFVWVPVSSISENSNETQDYSITLDNNNQENIILGRYTFSSDGTPSLEQAGTNYAQTVTISEVYQELTSTSTNTTAKNLQAFIESVEENNGYYIARFEASYGSGTKSGEGNDESYYKPLSKISTSEVGANRTYTVGALWNYVYQTTAAKASRQMYYGNSYVESDLMNSYAWDTAIVYIQKMNSINYANTGSVINNNYTNTGETGDEMCKIFDMKGNMSEWTTEHSTYAQKLWGNYSVDYPYVYRGIQKVSSSRSNCMSEELADIGFRPILYCKNVQQ